MNRKLLSLVATLVFVGQACGTASPSTAAVTLTLWHNYGTEANAAVTESLAKAYMALHPKVTIELVSQPADNYFALLKAAAIAKTGPDLLTMWTGLFALQNQAFLEPLNSYITVDELKTFRHQLVLEGPQRRDRRHLRFARQPVLQRLLQQELFAQAGVAASPRPGASSTRHAKAQGGRHPASRTAQRAGPQRRVLPLLRPAT